MKAVGMSLPKSSVRAFRRMPIRVIAADFQKSILTVLGDVHIPVSGAEEIFLQKVSLFDIFIGD